MQNAPDELSIKPYAVPLVEGHYQGGQLAVIDGQVVEIIPRNDLTNLKPNPKQSSTINLYVSGNVVMGNGNKINSDNRRLTPARQSSLHQSDIALMLFWCAIACLTTLTFVISAISKGSNDDGRQRIHPQVEATYPAGTATHSTGTN